MKQSLKLLVPLLFAFGLSFGQGTFDVNKKVKWTIGTGGGMNKVMFSEPGRAEFGAIASYNFGYSFGFKIAEDPKLYFTITDLFLSVNNLGYKIKYPKAGFLEEDKVSFYAYSLGALGLSYPVSDNFDLTLSAKHYHFFSVEISRVLASNHVVAMLDANYYVGNNFGFYTKLQFSPIGMKYRSVGPLATVTDETVRLFLFHAGVIFRL